MPFEIVLEPAPGTTLNTQTILHDLETHPDFHVANSAGDIIPYRRASTGVSATFTPKRTRMVGPRLSTIPTGRSPRPWTHGTTPTIPDSNGRKWKTTNEERRENHRGRAGDDPRSTTVLHLESRLRGQVVLLEGRVVPGSCPQGDESRHGVPSHS
jgi:hypothetical protein